jgi:DNA replication and repair protein RecF
MHVTHLSLSDFRSWVRADMRFEPGVSVFVGANGQGKTNLLEAVAYLSTLGSHRVASDAPLIRSGSDHATVQAAVSSGGRQLILEIEIAAGRANRAKLNRSPLARPRDLLGGLKTVLFAPEDLAVVRGDPAERRRFLDDVLIQRTPRLAAVRADYERVLKQRAALLKTAGTARRSGAGVDLRTLDVWDGHLAEFGAQLLLGRLELLRALRPLAVRAYRRLAPSSGSLRLAYLSSALDGQDPSGAGAARRQGTDGPDGPQNVPDRFVPDRSVSDRSVSDRSVSDRSEEPVSSLPGVLDLRNALLTELANVRGAELERGVNLAGPHRDDLELRLNDLPIRGYASHGEGWSAALALRLACFDLMCEEGSAPVLILDDVFAELDLSRREHLAEFALRAEQTLVSAAVPADLPDGLAGARFSLADGEVRRDP